jgi:hypothetical protein
MKAQDPEFWVRFFGASKAVSGNEILWSLISLCVDDYCKLCVKIWILRSILKQAFCHATFNKSMTCLPS